MISFFTSAIVAQTPPTTASTAQPPTTSSTTASSCSQIPQFTSCQNSFEQQKIQTCDRQVQKSEAVSQANCNVKVAKQILSCYNFCNIPSSGDERKAYAATVDTQVENLNKLKKDSNPTPTTKSSNSSETETETEDNNASNPNGAGLKLSDATTAAWTISAIIGVIAVA